MIQKTISLGDQVWSKGDWNGFVLSVHYPPRPADDATKGDPETEVMIYWTALAAGAGENQRYSPIWLSSMLWVPERARWELIQPS